MSAAEILIILHAIARVNGSSRNLYEAVCSKQYCFVAKQWSQPHSFPCRSLDEARAIALRQVRKSHPTALSTDVQVRELGAKYHA